MGISVMLCIDFVAAQNPHVYSQYFMNPYLYNPALAGVEGHSAVFFMYRQQWVGLSGAPEISHLNWHTPLRHSLGIGALIDNDRIGPLTTTQFKFTGSYLFNLDRTHFFRFGLSLGVGSDGVDYEGLIGDHALSPRYALELEGFRESSMHLLADFGVMYHFTRFNLGVSLPSLLGRRSVNKKSFSPTALSPFEHVFFKMNYRQSLFNDDIAIDPHVLYRYNSIGNSQLEFSLITHIAHIVWVGASYRQPSTIVALAGFKLFRTLAIGYAYDVTPSDLSSFAGPTHELHLGFHIGSRFDHVEHSHSFIKSRGNKKVEEEDTIEIIKEHITDNEEPLPGAEEPLPGAEKPLPGAEEPLPGVEEPLPGAVEPLPGAVEPLPGAKKPLPGAEEPLPGVEEPLPGVEEPLPGVEEPLPGVEEPLPGVEEPLPGVEEPLPGVEEPLPGVEEALPGVEEALPGVEEALPGVEEALPGVEEALPGAEGALPGAEGALPGLEEPLLDEKESINRGPTSAPTQDLGDGNFSPQELIGAIAHKGNHLMEMPTGSYVIVGAYEAHVNAEKYSEYLLRRGYVSRVGYNSERKYFYVDMFYNKDVLAARARRDEFRKRALFANAWVLTVIESE